MEQKANLLKETILNKEEIISEAKINIRDISTQQPDLEEIFKHLIAKK